MIAAGEIRGEIRGGVRMAAQEIKRLELPKAAGEIKGQELPKAKLPLELDPHLMGQSEKPPATMPAKTAPATMPAKTALAKPAKSTAHDRYVCAVAWQRVFQMQCLNSEYLTRECEIILVYAVDCLNKLIEGHCGKCTW